MPMKKLVTIKDNMIAFGQNDLEQLIIETGNVPGFLPEPVGIFPLLPTIFNGLGAPETGEGTIGIVQGTSSAAIYQYVSTRTAEGPDGPFEYLIDDWYRSEHYQRGLILMVNAVDVPCFFSRPGGDDLNEITSIKRLWQTNLTGTSTILEVGTGGIQAVNSETFELTAQGAVGAEAELFFTGIQLSTSSPKPTLFRMYGYRPTGVISDGPAPGMAAAVVFEDGRTDTTFTLNQGNSLLGGFLGFYSDVAPIGERGHGDFTTSVSPPWDRIDIDGEFGGDPLAVNNLDKVAGNWRAYGGTLGTRPGSTSAITFDQAEYSGVVPTTGRIRLLSRNGLIANVTQFAVAKFVALTTEV